MRKLTYLVPILLITLLFSSCKKSGNKGPNEEQPQEELVLLEKVYRNGQLHFDFAYDENHKIRQINHYKENGDVKSSRLIQLDDQGRIAKVIMVFGHYTSTRTLTFEGDRKVLDETVNEFDDGSPSTYSKRAWKYPAANVIVDLLYASDLETVNYTHTFSFLESGNIEKLVREVRTQPYQNGYEQFQYDEGLSYEYLIESNIPGYAEMPISKNQVLNQKIFKPDGELSLEIFYHNTYNEAGYLEKYLEESVNGTEEYRLIYRTISLP